MYIYIAYIICVVILISLGVVAILTDRKSSNNKAFLGITIISVYWVASLFLTYYFGDRGNVELSTFFIRLANSAGILAGFILAIFFYYFPRKTFEASSTAKIILLIATVFFFTISSFTALIEKLVIIEGGEIIQEDYGPLAGLFAIFSFGLIFLALGIGIKKMFILHGLERKKIKIVVIGLSAFVIVTVTTNFVIPLLYGKNYLVKESVLFSLLFTIPVFYSLQKHRFFDASNVALTILRKVVLLILFVSVALSVYGLITLITSEVDPIISVVISSITALLVFKRIEKVFPQFYTSSFRALTDGLAELRAKLVYGEDYEEFIKLLEEFFVIKMNIKNVRIFAIRSSDEKLAVPVYIKDELTEELEHRRNDLLVYDEIKFKRMDEDTKEKIRRKMNKIDSCLAIPLFSENNLIGIFSVGFKSKNEGFSREEILEILRIKHILEIGFMNILLKKNLQEENDFMKKVIEEKTKKLKEQFKQIKELLNQKSDFIAVTAHEFRTPLSIALFQLQDMMDTYEKNPGVTKDLEEVEKAIEDLKTLTQKLFDVQKYDLNKINLTLEPVGIKKYIKEIYKGFKTTADEKGIELSLKDLMKKEVEMQLDQSQMRQVFHNLLNNAFKFIPTKGGKIIIELSDDPKNIYIKIIDNGKGVSNEEKDKIFEKFRSKKNSAAAGIGLGLYLSFKITELHKGGIHVEDASGGGASFIINLPK